MTKETQDIGYCMTCRRIFPDTDFDLFPNCPYCKNPLKCYDDGGENEC